MVYLAASKGGSDKRVCALSCWLVCSAARRRREGCVLCHVDWLVLLLAKREEGEKWLARPFMLPRAVTRAEWYQSFSLGEIWIRTPTAKAIPAQNNNLKFFLLHSYIDRILKTSFLSKKSVASNYTGIITSKVEIQI